MVSRYALSLSSQSKEINRVRCPIHFARTCKVATNLPELHQFQSKILIGHCIEEMKRNIVRRSNRSAHTANRPAMKMCHTQTNPELPLWRVWAGNGDSWGLGGHLPDSICGASCSVTAARCAALRSSGLTTGVVNFTFLGCPLRKQGIVFAYEASQFMRLNQQEFLQVNPSFLSGSISHLFFHFS